MLFWYHTPYEGADYDHEWHSPLYKWVKGGLEKSGKLQDNLKIKYHDLYVEEEATQQE